MVTRRPVGGPEQPCKPSASPEPNLEALQNIFMSPAKFVVGTSASEAAYRRMAASKGGLSDFFEEAIKSFDGNLEALVLAAAAFEEERKQGRQASGVRSANGRVSQECFDRVVELENALKGIRRMSRAKVMAGLAKLLLQRREDWSYPLSL
jgi:hypothetical protein